MNSLTELNSYGDQSVFFTDERSYLIRMSNVSGSGTHVDNEGASITTFVGAEIDALRSVDQAASPAPVIYEISIPQAEYDAGARITWPLVPRGTTYEHFSNGVARISGISGVIQWNEVREATITNVRDRVTAYTYTSKIDDLRGNTRIWTGNVTLTASAETNITNPTAFTYAEGVPEPITTPFQITDVENTDVTDIYEVHTITNQAANATVHLSSTFLANGTPAGLTYVGTPSEAPYNGQYYVVRGTKSAVNNALSNFVFDPAADFSLDTTITWTVVNPMPGTHEPNWPTGGVTTTLIQETTCRAKNPYLTNENRPRTYVEQIGSKLFPSDPIFINQDIGWPSSLWVYITLSSNSGILSVDNGDLEHSGWNYSTRTLTLIGYRASLNATLANLYYLPYYGNKDSLSATIRIVNAQTGEQYGDTATFTITAIDYQYLNPDYSDRYLRQGSGTLNPQEDSTFSNFNQNVAANWSLGFGALIRTKEMGVYKPATSGRLIMPAGWTALADGSGYYKNFSYTTFLAWRAAMDELTQIQYKIVGDLLYVFDIETTLSSAAHYNAATNTWTPTTKVTTAGTLTAPGDLWQPNTATTVVNMLPVLDYNIRSGITYKEDTMTWVAGGINQTLITDQDTTPGLTYRISYQPYNTGSYSVAPKWFYGYGYPTDANWDDNLIPYSGDVYVQQGSKDAINYTMVGFFPPANYTGIFYIFFRLEKSYDNGATWVSLTPDPNSGSSEFNFVTISCNCSVQYNDYVLPVSMSTQLAKPIPITGVQILDAVYNIPGSLENQIPSKFYRTYRLSMHLDDVGSGSIVWTDLAGNEHTGTGFDIYGTAYEINQLMSQWPPLFVPAGKVGSFNINIDIILTSQVINGAIVETSIGLAENYKMLMTISVPTVGQSNGGTTPAGGMIYLGLYDPTTGTVSANGTQYLFVRRYTGTTVYNIHSAPASATLPTSSLSTTDGRANQNALIALWGSTGSQVIRDATLSASGFIFGSRTYYYRDFYVPTLTELNLGKQYLDSPSALFWTSNIRVADGVVYARRSDQEFTWTQITNNLPQAELAAFYRIPKAI